MIRRTFFSNEIMIIFSFNHLYLEDKSHLQDKIELLKDFFIDLAKKHEIIQSIYFSYNDNKADIAIGKLELIHGKKTINETLL